MTQRLVPTSPAEPTAAAQGTHAPMRELTLDDLERYNIARRTRQRFQALVYPTGGRQSNRVHPKHLAQCSRSRAGPATAKSLNIEIDLAEKCRGTRSRGRISSACWRLIAREGMSSRMIIPVPFDFSAALKAGAALAPRLPPAPRSQQVALDDIAAANPGGPAFDHSDYGARPRLDPGDRRAAGRRDLVARSTNFSAPSWWRKRTEAFGLQ